MWIPSTKCTLQDLVAYLEGRHRKYGKQDAIGLAQQCLADLQDAVPSHPYLQDAHRLVNQLIVELRADQREEAVAYGNAAITSIDTLLQSEQAKAAAV